MDETGTTNKNTIIGEKPQFSNKHRIHIHLQNVTKINYGDRAKSKQLFSFRSNNQTSITHTKTVI